MVANIQTIAFQGVEAVPVEVQVHLASGQNAFNVVGLPDKSVAESRERVRAALSARPCALWQRPMRAAANCLMRLLMMAGSRRAALTAFYASRAASPIWPVATG